MTSTPVRRDVAARRFDELDTLLNQATALTDQLGSLDGATADAAYAALVKEAGELADTVTLWAAGIIRYGSELAAVTHRLQREPSLATASQAQDLAGVIGLLAGVHNALRNGGTA